MQELRPKRIDSPKLKKTKKINNNNDSDYEENPLVLL